MVYTVTFNPVLDYVVRMRSFQSGETNRTESDELQWGGKGINVSTVLRNLGVDSVALGFLAGFTGQALDQGLGQMGLKTDFIWLPQGLTQINVKIKAGQETEINSAGPDIPAAAALEGLSAAWASQRGRVPGRPGLLAGALRDKTPRGPEREHRARHHRGKREQ